MANLHNRFEIDFGGYAAAKTDRQVVLERIFAEVEAMITTEQIPRNLNWMNADFQAALIHHLREARKWKADAEKLRVIKEVFGGSK